MDAAVRQLLMVQRIPAYPRKVSSAELMQYLEGEGFSVNLRTVQRDLNMLSSVLPLEVDDRNKPHGWFFRKDRVISLPGMNLSTALTFLLAQKHLRVMLPPSVISSIQPYFDEASKVIQGLHSSGSKDWISKVVMVPRGLQLQAAEVDSDVLATISQALMDKQAVEISRQGKGEHIVNPLGLVLRGPVIYLICTFGSYVEPRIVPLHRISNASVSTEPYQAPNGFSLQAYVDSGALGFKEKTEKIDLKIRFFGRSVDHLYETPLSDDQLIIKDGEHHIVTAS
ncbi:MAG: WYL domain-containing protein, partial [Gammaproteobacteria bacterium]|nr:WYL domain-containing protein [Gammaproteobacteria bacterium]